MGGDGQRGGEPDGDESHGDDEQQSDEGGDSDVQPDPART